MPAQPKPTNRMLEQRPDELARALIIVGICPACLQEIQHDVTEPFASCGCGTMEWTGEIPILQQLRMEIANLRKFAPAIVRSRMRRTGEKL
jgi:hypothetical protein